MNISHYDGTKESKESMKFEDIVSITDLEGKFLHLLTKILKKDYLSIHFSEHSYPAVLHNVKQISIGMESYKSEYIDDFIENIQKELSLEEDVKGVENKPLKSETTLKGQKQIETLKEKLKEMDQKPLEARLEEKIKKQLEIPEKVTCGSH